jgi:three-Cys-motif partner protein
LSRKDFGGEWTVEKLDILSKYWSFYLTALKGQSFNKVYIDAFAGSGDVRLGDGSTIDGSAKLALDASIKFDKYIFIEKDKTKIEKLKKLINDQYKELENRTEVFLDDCNCKINELCKSFDWKKNRAIMFLDPFAMSLKWDTLKVIANTKAIDVWYLFPISATTRLMKNDGTIEDSWKKKLDDIFGDNGWFNEFYQPSKQLCMFDDMPAQYDKLADLGKMKKYICTRLKTVFPAVADNPRVLYNTKNTPLFLFCFAVSNDNEAAIRLALKVANHILKPKLEKNL